MSNTDTRESKHILVLGDAGVGKTEYIKQKIHKGEFDPRYIPTKSGLMLGLGEKHEEILQAMNDLRQAGVDFLTVGQYLQPTRKHLAVKDFITPETFDELAEEGRRMGFEYVASGPLVRSSYRAAEFYIERKIRNAS